jgi:cysteine desulfuration protein SufE
MTIKEIQEQIIDEFSIYEDWMDKYAYIIELGSELPSLDSSYHTEDNLIKGCQSKVWFHASFEDGLIKFEADSDAIITKGIAAILIKVFSGQKPEDIINADLEFLDEIGLKQHLSPTRSNGLLSMVKQIKMYALAFSQINK